MSTGLNRFNPTWSLFIPKDVLVYLLYNVFSFKVIMFPAQKDSTVMFNCSPMGWLLANSSFLTHGAATISSQLLFLPAFLSVTEASHSNATMMVISLCLLKRVST